MREEPFNGIVNVRAFGAIGDGEARDTAAIQCAIDACASHGGGRVLVPPGVYRTGTLFLKDNVDLHIGSGATLLGSPDLADYNADNGYPQNAVFAMENVTGAHLIVALEARNVSITGHGRIDGNGQAFFDPPRCPGGKFVIRERRPGQMIAFIECEQVRVRDVALDNTPYWTLFLHGCVNVGIRGLRITNPPATPNGDGIDVDCCQDVTISDCVIRTGDDCITLRGNNRLLKDPSRICRNVTVTNCILGTPCNAIRVGVGNGSIRDCVFSNIVITETRNGICLIGNYKNEPAKGADIENIRFSNLTMATRRPLYVYTGREATCRIRQIAFADIRATGSLASFMSGTPGNRISGIHLRDVEIEMSGGKDTIAPPAAPGKVWREWDRGQPAALFFSQASDVTLDRVVVRWGAIDGPWQAALSTLDAEVTVRECDLPSPVS